tara:strand:- start:17130 stop:17285 length:156 start_codon:yes stop_codon:yes gene_type:complete
VSFINPEIIKTNKSFFQLGKKVETTSKLNYIVPSISKKLNATIINKMMGLP